MSKLGKKRALGEQPGVVTDPYPSPRASTRPSSQADSLARGSQPVERNNCHHEVSQVQGCATLGESSKWFWILKSHFLVEFKSEVSDSVDFETKLRGGEDTSATLLSFQRESTNQTLAILCEKHSFGTLKNKKHQLNSFSNLTPASMAQNGPQQGLMVDNEPQPSICIS